MPEEKTSKEEIITRMSNGKPVGLGLTEKKEKDNTVFIGMKPFMNYVRAVTMQFQDYNQKEVIVSARGKFISRAADVAEVVKRFLKDENIKIDDIKISSQGFENKEQGGKKIYVSTIEIKLVKYDK